MVNGKVIVVDLTCYMYVIIGLLSVATGVKLFKSGELSGAMKYFNHALEIDGQNVEGLVARGAL